MRFPVVSLAALFAATSAHAWSDHHRITRQALLGLPEIAGQQVIATPFQAVLDKLPQLARAAGTSSDLTFNEMIQIRKDFVFNFMAGEKLGEPINAIDVLATYSDEPDWHMDTELFDDDQYPEIWKPEYAMMGGRNGTPSQAFRHMYWDSLTPRYLFQTLHLPPQTFLHSMGQAPERARIFVALSRAAWKIPGLEYWALRFLADSLHYLEDVSQPYHTSQIPTVKFLEMPLFNRELGSGGKELVTQVQNILSYYHFAYEDYVAFNMKRVSEGSGGPEAQAIVDAISAVPDPRAFKGLEYTDHDPAKLVENMSAKAVAHANQAGKACVAFFPAVTVKYSELDAQAFMNKAWWDEVYRRGQADSKAKRDYFGTVEPMFTLVGEAVRHIVAAEVRFR